MPNFIDVMDRLDEMLRLDIEKDKKLDMIMNLLHGMMSDVKGYKFEDKHND